MKNLLALIPVFLVLLFFVAKIIEVFLFDFAKKPQPVQNKDFDQKISGSSEESKADGTDENVNLQQNITGTMKGINQFNEMTKKSVAACKPEVKEEEKTGHFPEVITEEDVIRGVIFKEILDEPRSRRKHFNKFL